MNQFQNPSNTSAQNFQTPGTTTNTQPVTAPGAIHRAAPSPAFEFDQPQANNNSGNQKLMIAVVAGGLGLCALGFWMKGGSSPAPVAAANEPVVTNYFTEQQKIMKEAMSMAKEAQAMQQERMAMMREQMDAEREMMSGEGFETPTTDE